MSSLGRQFTEFTFDGKCASLSSPRPHHFVNDWDMSRTEHIFLSCQYFCLACGYRYDVLPILTAEYYYVANVHEPQRRCLRGAFHSVMIAQPS